MASNLGPAGPRGRILAKVKAFERVAEALIDDLRGMLDDDDPVHEPQVPGRIRSLTFVRLARRLLRVHIDEAPPFVLHQTLAFTLLALTRRGGVARADGHEYHPPEAIADEIGRLRGTAPPSVRAVATYIARLRKELGAVRSDGKDLILGDVRGGWRLALHENAIVRFP